MNRSHSRASAKSFFLVFFLSSVLALFGITLLPGCTKKAERVGVMKRVRDLAIACAREYLASRERLGFPLLPEGPEERSDSASANAEVARG